MQVEEPRGVYTNREKRAFANAHENHEVEFHRCVAPGVFMAPLREFPTPAGICRLCGRHRGRPGCGLPREVCLGFRICGRCAAFQSGRARYALTRDVFLAGLGFGGHVPGVIGCDEGDTETLSGVVT